MKSLDGIFPPQQEDRTKLSDIIWGTVAMCSIIVFVWLLLFFA